MLGFLDTIIEYSFYLLFFLVPLVFTSINSELFEYNKMMLTYGITIIIAAAWIAKAIVNKKFNYRHTFLEIPLLLYLASHVLSTVFSIDPHTSIWGYYSRFHEGLLATTSYLILYFAAVSNLKKDHVLKILKISFISAAIVSIYGIFEHFGHSPSCLFITGNFDDACWVQVVKDRVFATLGQPNWMAAYLDVLILASLGFFAAVKRSKLFTILPTLFFAALLFTKSRSGILGLLVGIGIFAAFVIFNTVKTKQPQLVKKLFFVSCILVLVILAFGLPFSKLENLTFEHFLESRNAPKVAATAATPAPNSDYIDIGISGSDQIREVVWQGAIKVWQRYPIFGSGVETFAYSYYFDRPAAHNMLSEWDFLYNKAHNEFLNILATTGTVGFIAYLGIILTFTAWLIYNLFALQSSFGAQFTILNKFKMLQNLKTDDSLQTSNFKFQIVALFAAWVSILVTNFFGFSVVIIGLYFFLIPAFAFLLISNQSKDEIQNKTAAISTSQWFFVTIIAVIGLFLETNLVGMWQADVAYAYGKNLDSIQSFAHAYPYLAKSVQLNGDEPTFHDELSFNEATLASSLFSQLNSASLSTIATMSAATKAALKIPLDSIGTFSVDDLTQKAISDSNQAITTSPNSMPFWKTRTKTFYTLATIDSKYILDSLSAIGKAAELAPTDAKVHYNLGLLLGRTGQLSQAIKALEETVALKADYRDAYYALGLYYKEAGDLDKARAQMQYILKKIGPDADAQKFLEENK